MFSQREIWDAIEGLARSKGLSLSALALRAGLDSTALNRSKRAGPEGKLRWPSTETLAKLLAACDVPFGEFCRSIEQARAARGAHRGTILFVDDDADFCRASAASLDEAGYHVHVATHHRDALDILESVAALDLLCTDIVMPEGLGGPALAARARSLRPALKVLYMTGYDIPGFELRCDQRLLRKPFGANNLLDEVGQLIA